MLLRHRLISPFAYELQLLLANFGAKVMPWQLPIAWADFYAFAD